MTYLILDLFSGAGGAARGYADAGFEVVGVDIEPQPNYPFGFLRRDALEFLRCLTDPRHDPVGDFSLRYRSLFRLQDFHAIHASPPCQAYSLIAAGGVRRKTDHPDLIGPVRELLKATGLPYVIENVPQAPLIDPVTYCGTTFGLPIIRHRSFECSLPMPPRPCGYAPTARVRHKDYPAYPYGRKSWRPAWREHVLPEVWPWMTIGEAAQAIPPAYTEFIGRTLIAYLDWGEQ